MTNKWPKAGDDVIVKVQLHLFTTEVAPMALVYDRTRQYEAQVPAPKEVIRSMRGQHKAFFKAILEPDMDHEGSYKLRLVHKVVDRDW